jgi:hypothetical protein
MVQIFYRINIIIFSLLSFFPLFSMKTTMGTIGGISSFIIADKFSKESQENRKKAFKKAFHEQGIHEILALEAEINKTIKENTRFVSPVLKIKPHSEEKENIITPLDQKKNLDNIALLNKIFEPTKTHYQNEAYEYLGNAALGGSIPLGILLGLKSKKISDPKSALKKIVHKSVVTGAAGAGIGAGVTTYIDNNPEKVTALSLKLYKSHEPLILKEAALFTHNMLHSTKKILRHNNQLIHHMITTEEPKKQSLLIFDQQKTENALIDFYKEKQKNFPWYLRLVTPSTLVPSAQETINKKDLL